MTVEVTDAGPEFDPAAAGGGRGRPISSQEFSFETGLSLPVVRGLVEDLEIAPPGRGGMTVRFTIKADRTPG